MMVKFEDLVGPKGGGSAETRGAPSSGSHDTSASSLTSG